MKCYFFASVIRALLLCISYEYFYRSAFVPRFWILGLFLIITFFVTFLLRKKKCLEISKKQSFFICAHISILVMVFAFVKWGLKVFPLADVDQVLMTLQMPMEGFTSFFVLDFFKCTIPLMLVFTLVIYHPFLRFLSCFKRKRIAIIYSVAFVVIACCSVFCYNIPMQATRQYLSFFINPDTSVLNSDFFEKNYVRVDNSLISADTTTKNLILVYLESVENTFYPYMPELEKLANANKSFYKNPETEGGICINGAKNTIASLITSTTGIPFLIQGNVFTEKIGETNAIFPEEKSLYNILHDFGYTNIYIKGASSKFAGAQAFLRNHGIDNIYDADNINLTKDISITHRKNSFSPGFTDRTIFSVAKEILDTISNKPFSLTITTLDTHFPNGFYDEQCEIKPEKRTDEEILKAVLRCSSKSIDAFIRWLKEQSYFKNTEIILVGDHLFMGKMLVEDKSMEHRKFVSIIINPQKEVPNFYRNFTAMDMFPTMLESMGFTLRSNRLGFGQSLYQEEKTLVEKYGEDSLNNYIKSMTKSREYLNLF